MIEVLALCPGNLVTGGTEGIHHLVQELNKHPRIDAKIWYVNGIAPEAFSEYECEFVTELPNEYKGVLIFPEVWADKVIEYSDNTVVINWQGVDVYEWNTSENERYKFLQRKDAIHVVGSEYAKDFLSKFHIHPLKICDCINAEFFTLSDAEVKRSDVVLYNPVPMKLTKFQRAVMARCTTELGIKFHPLEGYTRQELIEIFQHSKLYIDFGVFSGRERLPREAVMCGCCILTSKLGTAGYFKDNAIPDEYKIDTIDRAIQMIDHILRHYNLYKADFDFYRQCLKMDLKVRYPQQVKELADAILNHNSGV